jgi:hypothetical protein
MDIERNTNRREFARTLGRCVLTAVAVALAAFLGVKSRRCPALTQGVADCAQCAALAWCPIRREEGKKP